MTVVGQQLCLLPFLYADGAQWSIQRKVGYVCSVPSPKNILHLSWSLPFLNINQLYWLDTSSEPVLFLLKMVLLNCFSVFPLSHCSSSCCCMHERSRLSMQTTELFSLEVNAALFLRIPNRATVCCCRVHNGQSREHKRTSVYEREKTDKDAIHAVSRTLLQHTDRCAPTETRQTFSCIPRLEECSLLTHGMHSSSCGSAADAHTAMWHYKQQKKIWQQNFPWNMRDFRD